MSASQCKQINAALLCLCIRCLLCQHGNMPWTSSIFIYGYLPSTEYLTQNASRQIILVMLILCYHLWFQMDFACPCSSSRNIIHCYSYLVLPSVIIVSMIMWNDKRMGRIFRYLCYHSTVKRGRCSCKGKFCVEFITYFLQAVASGFLWCGSVLVDGDWYVCCGNSEDLMALSCMKDSQMGPAEKAKKIHLKNQSLVIGLICILLTAACYFIFALPWNRWCARKNHFRAMFEETILEQTEIVLWDEMKKAAADAVTHSLANLSAANTPAGTSERVEKTEAKEDLLLNLNVDWHQISCLADAVIESIPNNNDVSMV